MSLIDSGRLLGTEDPRTIGRWVSKYERVVAAAVPAPVATTLARLPGVAAVDRLPDGGVRVHTDAEGSTAAVLRALLEAGVTEIATTRPSLEEVYLHVIGDRGLAV